MSNFIPITGALEPWFDRDFEDIPRELQRRIEAAFVLIRWDSRSPEGRRNEAGLWDYSHDPATERDRQKIWDLRIEIKNWEEKTTPTALDFATQKSAICRLAQELAAVDTRANAYMTEITSDQPLRPPDDSAVLDSNNANMAVKIWYETWDGDKGKASDQDVLAAAGRGLPQIAVTRAIIREVRENPDGTNRKRGRKPGKTVAELGRQ